jgi:Mg-chelatase subunit ChlD
MTESFKLTSSSLQSFKNRIGIGSGNKPLRATLTRQKHLDKIARLMSGVDTKVQLGDSAYCRKDPRYDYLIELPKTETEQPATSLDTATWHLIYQETELFHELGHVLYTDFDAREQEKNKLSGQAQQVYLQLSNAGEDGAINFFLSREFNIRQDMILMYANLSETHHQSHSRQGYNFWSALSVGLLDHGFYDSGRWSEFMESDEDLNMPQSQVEDLRECDSLVKETMTEMLTEPSGAERARIMREFTEEVIDLSNHSANPEDTSSPDEHEESDGEQEAEPDTPDEMDFDDEEEQDSDSGMAGADEDGDEEEGADEDEDEQAGGGSGDSGGSGEDGPSLGDADASDLEEIEAELSEDRGEEVGQQRDMDETEDDSLEDEEIVEQFENSAKEGSLNTKIFVPDEAMPRSRRSVLKQAKQKGHSLEQILRSQLQEERSSTDRYGVREGRLNTSALARATTGDDRVFVDQNEPEEKDYSVQLILDRSGSMDNQNGRMKAAERATLQLAYGLDGVGVDVSVMSFRDMTGGYSSAHTCLELPFGADINEWVDELLCGDSSAGSTPLSDMIELAAEQVKHGEFDNHFVMVITDGHPGSEHRYKKALEKIDVPVYGVYVDNVESNHGNHSDYFDAVRYATIHDVDDKVRSLCLSLIG